MAPAGPLALQGARGFLRAAGNGWRGHAVFGLGDRAERADRRPALDAGLARSGAEAGLRRRGRSAGGGHGLATAYYLAKNHGITNVAVLERGYLGGGNVGRNTTIVRANYLLPGNSEFYSHSLKLWEGLERELNYNVMMSQRGRAEPLPFGRAVRRLRAARQRDAAAGGRRGAADARRGAGACAVPELRRCAVPDLRRAAAPAGRDGAARRGGLGVRAGRRTRAAST